MSKKNSNAILKNQFNDFEELSEIYINFRKKLKNLKTKSFVVAVSGGPDSLALAALTKALSYEYQYKFSYALIDHKLRKNSSIEAKKVKTLLKKFNISINIIPNKHRILKNVQSQARLIRYKLLSNFCKKKKIKTIITAHNLEDQVETFFIRLSRGSGLTGLSGMKSLSKLDNNVVLFRPLLNVKKVVLIRITKKIFGKYFNDPSNKSKKYLRTKIRNLKKPLINSGVKFDQIIKSINNLASSKATLDTYFADIYKNTTEKSKGKILVNLSKFNKLNNELKMHVINKSIKILRKNYYNPRSKKVDNLIKHLKTKKFTKSTLAGCIFHIENDNLSLKVEKR